MKIEDLEVGKSYTRYDDAQYLVIFIDPKNRFFVALHYSMNHCIMHPTVYTQEFLDEDYNAELHEMNDGWDLMDMLECNEMRVADDWSIVDEG